MRIPLLPRCRCRDADVQRVHAMAEARGLLLAHGGEEYEYEYVILRPRDDVLPPIGDCHACDRLFGPAPLAECERWLDS